MKPRLEIHFNKSKITSIGVDTVLGNRNFSGVHPDSKFLSSRQFKLYRQANMWMIKHEPDATNATIVDHKALTQPLAVQDGMTVSVGNPAKGIEKLPLQLHYSNKSNPAERPPAQPASAPIPITRTPVKKVTDPSPVSPSSEVIHPPTGEEEAERIVDGLSSSETRSLESLAASIKRKIHGERALARAIYRWIATNISYDVDMLRGGAIRNKTASEAFRDREAICGGYSYLYQDLANKVGLTCKFITGMSKGGSHFSGGSAGQNESHAWNAVQIDGNWQLLDVTWGAGSLNEVGQFKAQYEPFYFATPAERFVRDHLPSDPHWQLLDKPVDKGTFDKMIGVKPRFYDLGLQYLDGIEDYVCVEREILVRLKSPSAKLNAMLTADGGGSLPAEFTLCQSSDIQIWEIRAITPAAGSFDLAILAQSYNDKHKFEMVSQINIESQKGDPSFKGFPQMTSVFLDKGAVLEKPLEGHLRAGIKYRFSLRVPGATSVRVFEQNGRSAELLQNGDIFTGEIEPSLGRLDLMVSNDSLLSSLLGASYESLLHYKVE